MFEVKVSWLVIGFLLYPAWHVGHRVGLELIVLSWLVGWWRSVA